MLLALTGCVRTSRTAPALPVRSDSVINASSTGHEEKRPIAGSMANPEQRVQPSIESGSASADGNPLAAINRVLEDAFFDFDRYELRNDAIQSLQSNSTQLKVILANQPSLMLVVEGHCDELGSAEYNLALGERRAEVAREFLVQLGIPENRLRTLTWGKERPVCTEPTEACRQRNRRAHVRYAD
jgi:outer membrane protein OmpA-like peptidoglycan-associated protein